MHETDMGYVRTVVLLMISSIIVQPRQELHAHAFPNIAISAMGWIG